MSEESKYTGHTPGPWDACEFASPPNTFYVQAHGQLLIGAGKQITGPDARLIADASRLLEERDAAMRALESLTPGGSEYVGNIQRCVQTVRDTRGNLMEQLRKRVEERDALLAAAKQVLEMLSDWENADKILQESGILAKVIALVEGRK